MADKQISELQKATSLNGNELLVISQDGKAKNITVDELGQMMPGGGSPDAVLYTPQTLTEAQKAQARENIGAASAEETETYLDTRKVIVTRNLLDGAIWSTGFYYASGGLEITPSACVHGTMYSNKIAVTPGDVLTLVYTAPGSQASNMWQVICEFNANGKFIQRVGGAVTGTIMGASAVYTKEYTVPDNVAFLSLCARGIYDWKTPTESVTRSDPTNTLRLESAETKTLSRLLPTPIATDEGKTPVVVGGVYVMQTMQTPETITDYLNGSEANNLLEGCTWTPGFLHANGSVSSESEAFYYGCGAYTDMIEVTPGAVYRYVCKVPASTSEREGTVKSPLEVIFNEHDYAKQWYQRNILPLPASNILGNYEIVEGEYIPGEGVYHVVVGCRTFRTDYDGSKVLAIYPEGEEEGSPQRLLPLATPDNIGQFLMYGDGGYVLSSIGVSMNPNIKSVNHRGYNTVAPENTLSAYRLSKKKGFDYVECDVQFTSDGVPVLLHDGTIDRTSNGTGDISTLTLDEVRAFDFGSWMSDDYAGEQIPTFEEFIILCKRIGLHPYIEIKGGFSLDAIKKLTTIVKRYGMQGKVTWVSFYQNSLTNLKSVDPTARLGFITETNTDDVITTANGLKTDENEVFINIGYYALTEDFLNKCVENNIPLESWTINDVGVLKSLDPYISGYSSDVLQADKVLYEAYGG